MSAPVANTGMTGESQSTLEVGARSLEVTPDRPVVIGILNATPDSFSDGGRYKGVEAQVARGRALHESGAALVEVGGESGVTHRPAVTANEEIGRKPDLKVIPASDNRAQGAYLQLFYGACAMRSGTPQPSSNAIDGDAFVVIPIPVGMTTGWLCNRKSASNQP